MNQDTDNKIKSTSEQGKNETLLTTISVIGVHDSDTFEFAPGAVVGEAYEVLAVIGSGGMGNVYRVKHMIMQKEYALKTLSADQVTEVAWRRFQKEAQAIARMSHPNIVSISNLGLHQGYLPYYVMDLLHGKTLLEILHKCRTLAVSEALAIFIEASSAIGYAHKKGIVHRDIKPGNIIILDKPDAASRLKIVDFGIAKLSGTKDVHSQQLTSVGEICGSPFYMSPEQCLSGRIDARADIYSLGCTLFETLTGSPPFRGKNAVETMLMHQSAAPTSLETASGGKHFPPMLESIVAAMLAKTPMDRYQNMELLVNDLTAALAGKDLPINPYGANAIVTHGQSTLNAVEPAKDKKPFYKSNFNQLMTTTVCAGGLYLGAAGAWWCGLNRPVTIKTVKDSIAHERPGLVSPAKTSEAAKAPENDDDFSKTISFLTGDVPGSVKHFSSSTDTQLFSQVKIKAGKMYKVFHFPTDVSLGILRKDHGHSFNLPCLGTVEALADERLILDPSQAIQRYPQYLKRFRAGDLYGLVFTQANISNRIFAAGADIPYLRRLKLEDCTSLTVKSLPTLYKYDSLEDFRYSNGPFSGQDISKMPRFKYLKTLHFAGTNVSPLLIAARQADKLKELNLFNCMVSKADLEIISGISQLRHLAISSVDITSAEILQLAKLPHLQELTLAHCPISTDAIAQFKQLKTLKKMWIGHSPMSAKQLRDLRANLPQVKLDYKDDKSTQPPDAT